MAAIVFDVREAERKLKAAGASEELAEATADLMSEAVLSNLDALVTKDYLDARLEAHFSQLDLKFRDIDAQFERVDARFKDMEARFDARFEGIDSRFEGMESKFDARFDQLRTETTGSFRLIHALLAILMAGVFIPQLQLWLGG